MTNPTGLPPGVPVPPRNPINAGQAFIGLCNARGVALQLFYYRVIQVFVTNIAGMTGAAVTLSGVPTWKILFPLACGSTFACFLQYPAMGIMKRSAERVDLWTGKLAALENTNGVEGGVAYSHPLSMSRSKAPPPFRFKDCSGSSDCVW